MHCTALRAFGSVLFILLSSAACLVGCDGGKQSASTQPGGAGTSTGKKLTIGFSQIGSESTWRTANTDSIKSEAEKRGINLVFTDAQQKAENQIQAINTFISRKVDVIAFSPVVSSGWEPTLTKAKAAGIPVLICDRAVDVKDDSLYTAYIGFDSKAQGAAAGKWLAEKTGGQAGIVELQGTTGSDPAIERKKGFEEAIASKPEMKILKSQTGDFTRAKGREVMEAFLKSSIGSEITAVYAHNDDMALGAIQAIEAAGKKPGTDVIVVSVDAVHDAFVAMSEGKLNCTVECSPLIGPIVFDTAEKIAKGLPFEKKFLITPEVFPQDKAAALLPTRKY